MNKKQSYDISNYHDEIQSLWKTLDTQTAYENILAFLINNNMTESEKYVELWNDYIDYMRVLEKEKYKFFTNVVQNFNSSDSDIWQVLCEEEILIIYEKI